MKYATRSEINTRAHILYITEDKSESVVALNSQLGTKSTLLITEKPGYLSKGAVVPHGIYDLGRNTGYISIGNSHETAEFIHDNILWWWDNFGIHHYPDTQTLLILCDSGGANSYRHHAFKKQVLLLAQKIGVDIIICHYPPYASKWNPIEHRLFPHVSNALRRGATMENIEQMAQKISQTKTKTGVSVSVFTTGKKHQIGRKYSLGFKENNKIAFDEYLPRWNYTAKACP